MYTLHTLIEMTSASCHRRAAGLMRGRYGLSAGRLRRMLPGPVMAWMLLMLLGACGSVVPAPPSVLTATGQGATFAQVQHTLDALYLAHPDITTFEVRHVRYPVAARDRVLTVCRQGAEASTASAREAQDILACAPLIFFFYSYGQQNNVPEAIDAARQLYGYATTNQPAVSTKPLTDLLQTWGIT